MISTLYSEGCLVRSRAFWRGFRGLSTGGFFPVRACIWSIPRTASIGSLSGICMEICWNKLKGTKRTEQQRRVGIQQGEHLHIKDKQSSGKRSLLDSISRGLHRVFEVSIRRGCPQWLCALNSTRPTIPRSLKQGLLRHLGTHCSGHCCIGFRGFDIEEEKLDSFNVPYYTSSTKEVQDVVEREGSFAVEHIDSFAVHVEGNLYNIGEKFAKRIRVFTESFVAHHFGEELMGKIYDKLTRLLVEDLSI